MSEQHNKPTGELSIDELDAVAGGSANVVNTSRSNIKNNITEVAPPPAPATPVQATPALAAPPASSF
jgi:hypothetical protein